MSDDESSVTGKSTSEKDLNESSVESIINISSERNGEGEKDTLSKDDTSKDESRSTAAEKTKEINLPDSQKEVFKDSYDNGLENSEDTSKKLNVSDEDENFNKNTAISDDSSQLSEKVIIEMFPYLILLRSTFINFFRYFVK